jgi:endonuclease/exonuclease/phosphatase family metal-dependent hydrolase
MRWSVSLLLCLSAACVPPVSGEDAGIDAGTPVMLRVMTWNARQLGADGGTSAPVATQIAALKPDMVTLQELTSAAMLTDLLARLPGYEGRAGVLAAGSGNLLQAVLWKPDVVSVESVQDLFTSGAEATNFPRPPLAWVTKVTARSTEFGVVAVHLKAGTGSVNEQTRISALGALDSYLRGRVSSGERTLMLLGDFNEALSDPRSAEAFAPFTGDTYRVPTLALADAGVVTFLPARLYFDHVVTTLAVDAGTVSVPPLDTQVAGYRQDVSDHLPVILDVAF